MAMYRVQQKATVWYEVVIEADNEDEALEFGIEALSDGDGFEASGSFMWQEDYWVEEQ